MLDPDEIRKRIRGVRILIGKGGISIKKKLIAALCLILCSLLGGWIGYSIGNPGHRNSFDRLSSQWDFDWSNPPLIADVEAASTLAEEYYRKNFDPDGSDPRLAAKTYYIPQIETWRVVLMPEKYVLAARGSYSTLTSLASGYYSVDILAEDGTILRISFS